MQYGILGPLEVRVDGEPAPLPAGKQRTLLALLLLRANELVSADRLVEELWEGEPPETAANTLQVYVSRLRKIVGTALERGATGYVLHVGEEELDATRFEQLLRDGRPREALALWRGTPLADVELPHSAQAGVGRLEELRLAALEERIEADLAAAADAGLVAELEALVDEHPLRERLRGQLMLALYRAGRQAEALELYRRTRELLVEELGIDPGPELQELERAVLRHDPALAPAAAAAHAVPAPPTPTLGREREVDELLALLRRPDVRLVTLTGPGGIGKTRLAVEAARAGGGRAAVVELAPIVDRDLVLPTVAQALDAPPSVSPVEAVRRAVGEAQLLLVLDNFEQVLAAAPAIGELLAAVPSVTVLVTSRAPLHVSGEHEYAVPPLSASAACSLFLERAQAVDRAFALTAENAPAVAEICSRLEGLPLAIELAAARTKLLPPQAMLARLGNQLDLLRGGARDLPERQQTLRATIDWSYGLLDGAEQRLFAQLGVFVGGFTLEAAEAVADVPGVLDGLASLVDKSLVRRNRADEARFGMLETVRDYALERLGDEAGVRGRHGRHYLGVGLEAGPTLYGPTQTDVLELLEAEYDNLRAAFAFLLAAEPEDALALADALRRFWQVRGHLGEGRRALEAALARTSARTATRARALNGLGILAGEQGALDEASVCFAASLELAEELGDDDRIAAALANVGNIEYWAGNLDAARTAYERVAELAGRRGTKRGMAIAIGNLGGIAFGLGEHAEAVRLCRESVALAREAGDAHQEAFALKDGARALYELGDLQASRADFVESLEILVRLGQRTAIADCLEGLGMVAEEPERSAILFGAATALRESVDARRLPDQETWYRRGVARARGALGGAFDGAFERGSALDLDAAVAFALGMS